MIKIPVVGVSLGRPHVSVFSLGGALAHSEGHRGLVELVSGAVPVWGELQLPHRGLQVLKQYFLINVSSYFQAWEYIYILSKIFMPFQLLQHDHSPPELFSVP